MRTEAERPDIVVTGMGIRTPIGSRPAEVLDNLLHGRSGIGPIRSFDTTGFRVRYAAEVDDCDADASVSRGHVAEIDRATRLALLAARAACDQAHGALCAIDPARIALAVGVSGAGQFQNVRFTLDRQTVYSAEAALYHLRNVPHLQSTVLAEALGIAGPCVTFSCASAGSAVAIGHAMDLLALRKADVAVAGGSEILTITNAAGMDALKLCASGACSPFFGTSGMTFGEGAAYFVIERADAARRRGATILAHLLGWAIRHDAYDSVATDPSGRGLARAMRAALAHAGVEPEAVGWIKASGTGNREQDVAETLAVTDVVGTAVPVTSFEPYVGHANGAAPAIGLAVTILARQAGVVIPTLNPGAARPGCGARYVTNLQRAAASPVVANSIAFGGGNASLVVGDVGTPRIAGLSSCDEVCITGIGIVSSVGIGVDDYGRALREKRSGIGEIDRWDTSGMRPRRAGLVHAEALKAASADTARLDRLQRYAIVAVDQAIANAGLLVNQTVESGRIGLFVALARGSASVHEKFADQMFRAPHSPSTGKLILRMGRFHVTSTLAARFGIRGHGATISDGATAGLHALAHAREFLRDSSDHDAVIVVAADELSGLTTRMLDELGWLAHAAVPGGEVLRPYASPAGGMILGEGAGAVVLERSRFAKRRGAKIRAFVSGSGLTGDRLGHLRVDVEGRMLSAAIQTALDDAGVQASAVDVVYGHGRGLQDHDGRELRAFARAFAALPSVGSITAAVGFAEAASGLFTVAAAVLGMESGQVYAIGHPHDIDQQQCRVTNGARRIRQPQHAIVAGSTESGNNAAIVLKQPCV
jgi:3-oxoacyl-[acyl-carrier-protein] synthase II